MKRKLISSEIYYGIILTVLICIYHVFFVLSTIPPQQGWWHYMGWRLNEGDVLYKDIYCYVQPFFPWLVAAMYKFFGFNFALYIIPGILIRILETLMVYKILIKFVKPIVAVFISFFSIIYTACVLYDGIFDYNTTILFLAITNAYLFSKFIEQYEDEKKRKFYSALLGLSVGIHFLAKQNTGVIVSFTVFVLFIITILWKEGKSKLITNVSYFLVGALLVILPAFVYILATKAFPAYINCVVFGMSAKGSTINKIHNIINNMLNIYDVLIAITILLLIYIQEYKSAVSNKLYCMLNGCLILINIWCVWKRFGYALRGLHEIFKTTPEFMAITLFLTLLWAIWGLFKRKKSNFYLVGVAIVCIFTVILFYWSGKTAFFHRTIFYSLDFYPTRTHLLYIIHYIYFIFWIIDTCKIVKTRDFSKAEIYVFNTIIMALYFSSLLSSTPEELFALPAVAYVISRIFCWTWKFNFAKNSILIFCSISFVLICFSQKMFMPYTWHGWEDTAIEKDNLTFSSIAGLEGYLLPKETEEKYELIVNAILENSSEDDTVYQFPTIMLFNVLTQRRTPTYMPVHYFDVCSDERAIADAEYLVDNPPKIVIWDELGEASWAAHEQIFRDGKRSGQRNIQDFYYTTVQKKYRLVVSVDNNLGGNIEVWVLNENANSPAMLGRIE